MGVAGAHSCQPPAHRRAMAGYHVLRGGRVRVLGALRAGSSFRAPQRGDGRNPRRGPASISYDTRRRRYAGESPPSAPRVAQRPGSGPPHPGRAKFVARRGSTTPARRARPASAAGDRYRPLEGTAAPAPLPMRGPRPRARPGRRSGPRRPLEGACAADKEPPPAGLPPLRLAHAKRAARTAPARRVDRVPGPQWPRWPGSKVSGRGSRIPP